MPEAGGTVVVVPCFDEEQRIRTDAFRDFLACNPDVRLVLVNDGSTDGTLDLLRALESAAPGAVEVVDLPTNRGKAEAVRSGVQKALASGAAYVGYWDADLATPLEAIPEFRELLEAQPRVELVMGSRVHLLGRHIERHALRHYLGRVAATLIAVTLDLRIYDSQCGAKLLRVGPRTGELFREPFMSRWLFDVELLARLVRERRDPADPPAAEFIYEHPLRHWVDVRGSKLSAGAYLRAAFDLVRIRRRYPPRDAGPPPRY